MKKQYIKHPIPEAISEDGGASIVFVNKQTVPLDGAITEALAGNYCTGQKTLIRNFFFGLMQSMADGVRRDGHARQIANFLTVYPVFKGEIDLEHGYDPEANGVMIRARLLNEMDLDITDWSFEDVTPGKKSFKIDSVKAGETLGVYVSTEAGNLNGKNLPSTEAGEELRVHWEIEGTGKSGDIDPAKLTSDVSRIDIEAGAIEEFEAEDDGKTIVFTVRGNFSAAKIAATVKYVAVPTVTGWKYSDDGDNWIVKDGGECQEIYGKDLPTEDYGATKPNRVTVTFTKPGEADPTTVVCDVATFASTANRVKVQPGAALVAALGSMDVGESISATMNLIVDGVEIALTDLHLEKG